MQSQDFVSPAAEPTTLTTSVRELSLQEMQAVAGGGLLLSERAQPVGPAMDGLLLAE